jgi:hypothetical protein
MIKPWENSDFERSKKRFNIFFTVVCCFIGFIFVCIVAAYIGAGYLIVKSTDEVKEVGLKAVVERIWCGPNAKCL